MMRDTYEAILRLKALRSFEDRPVSDDDMDAVLEAARWTGSSKNRQNWSFIVVDDPIQRERLAGALRHGPVGGRGHEDHLQRPAARPDG